MRDLQHLFALHPEYRLLLLAVASLLVLVGTSGLGIILSRRRRDAGSPAAQRMLAANVTAVRGRGGRVKVRNTSRLTLWNIRSSPPGPHRSNHLRPGAAFDIEDLGERYLLMSWTSASESSSDRTAQRIEITSRDRRDAGAVSTAELD